ncbi:MAG: class I adenylate cyclase [Thermodesulfobacteriota bacterium]
MAEENLSTSLADKLRRLSGLTDRPPPERVRADIAALLRSFWPPVPVEGEDLLAVQRTLSQAAHLLLRRALAAGEDRDLAVFYLQCIAGLGPAAEPCLAGWIFRRLEAGAAPAAILDEIPEEGRLPLLDRILIRRLAVPPDLAAEAMRRLSAAAAADLDRAAALLKRRSEADLRVSYGLRHTLFSGPFLERTRDRLAAAAADAAGGRNPDESLTDLLRQLACLSCRELAGDLADLLQVKSVAPLLALLTVLARMGGPKDVKLAKPVSRLLMHPNRRVQTAAMEALAALAPKDLGRLFAALFSKNEALRTSVLARLLLLSRAEYDRFLEALPAAARNAAALPLFKVLARLDPGWANSCLQDADEGSAKVRSALASHIPARPAAPDQAAARAEMDRCKAPAPAKAKDKKSEKSSLFSFGGGGEGISISFGEGGKPREERGPAKGGAVSGKAYKDQSLRAPDFASHLLEDVTFTGCAIAAGRFAGSVLAKVRFVRCTFEDCDFEGARFFDCSFEDCSFSLCALAGAQMCRCTLLAVRLHECSLWGLGLFNSALRGVRLRGSDLSGGRICGVRAGGLEFILCDLRYAVLHGLTATTSELYAVSFAHTAFAGLITDNPHLLAAEDAWLDRLAAGAEGMPADEVFAGPADADASRLATDIVQRYLDLRDARAKSLAFLTNNQRRTDWCLERMGPVKSECYLLAPFLLHTEVFERFSEIPPLALPCRMAGYTPTCTVLEIARKHFPSVDMPREEPDPVLIQALYTIGSVGTVAQTAASDLDYWVCYDPEDMPEVMVDGLTYKLEAIEQWADATFDVEVHFFTMDLTRIQANNFGVSDAESSGTAQAMLLKEEFYRTVLLVSGKLPAWCVTPPGADNAAYAGVLDFLARTPLAGFFVDLGNLEGIPAEEFFGASLWQIVKALKSPFKSIMKFGLLEKYIAAQGGPATQDLTLLCDRLKANVLNSRVSLLTADPYLLLFKEVSDFYRQIQDKESLHLVRLSFFLKTKVREMCVAPAAVARWEEKEIRDLFLGAGSSLGAAADQAGEEWSFDRLLHIGGLVNKFIIRTYLKVREQQSGGAGIAITPQDLTKLGRKIFSSFSKRKNKIEHIPFVSLGGVPFRVLHFAAHGKKIGAPEDWYVTGSQEVSTSALLKPQNLRAGKDIVDILTWLASNSLYNAKMALRGDYSISPVTVRDIEGLLAKLLQFFPGSATFNTDINETLNPERVVRALFALNFAKQREKAEPMEVSVVYSTNWGELFCRTVAVRDTLVTENPLGFLEALLETDLPEKPEMDYFIPERSVCPKPKF